MANADEMMIKMKCPHINENFLYFYDEDAKEDIIEALETENYSHEAIAAYRDADASFLGNIGFLFAGPDDTDKFLNSYNKAWRSFIDFIDYKDGELKIYYRSADGGSKEFFQSLKENFNESIENGCITLSDDLYGEELEFLQDEYGEDFCIEL